MRIGTDRHPSDISPLRDPGDHGKDRRGELVMAGARSWTDPIGTAVASRMISRGPAYFIPESRASGRGSKSLYCHRKHIANASLGLDEAGGTGISLELAPQAEDLHVDAAIEHVLVHPRSLQQLLTAERA